MRLLRSPLLCCQTLSFFFAQEILNKVKAIYFALWQGIGSATTQQMVEFYEVSGDAVQKALQRHRDELSSDGLKTIRGKALKDAVDKLKYIVKTVYLSE